MARPAKYATKEERLAAIRVQTRERVARWRAAHPIRWRRIQARFRAAMGEAVTIPLKIK